ncbi:MAG TPA: tetratricopeptide repeat protein [Burkholderiales bacterium]|nr:tetratricopeptide repeat protein [Burkholderiales bacterium]
MFEPDELAPAPATERFEPFAAPTPSSTQAATILRATEAQTVGWVDWVRDHPVHTFAMVAGVFMVFYGTYVYLQLFHPAVLRGDFLSSPLAAKAPPPPTQQPLAPPPAPAPAVAGTAQAPAPSPTQPLPTVAASPIQAAPQPTAQSGPMAPVAAPPARMAGRPQTRAQPSGAARAEQPSQPISPVPRRARPSTEESLAAAPMVEDHVSTAPAQSGRASLSPGITEAYQALQAGKLDQAEALYRGVVQADAQNVDALLGLATIASRRGNAQQSIGFYEQALRLEPRNAVAQAGLIDIIGQADPQMSETHLKQLIAREPSAFLYFSLGNLYARQAVWPAAQSAYFQAYNLQPDNPDYAYNLAIGLEHLEQPKLALTYYRKALELSFQKGHANFDQNRVIERVGQLAARVD